MVELKDGDQLCTIAYTSLVKRKEDIPAILAASNKNNPRDSLSGVLWYEESTGRVIQILEGPRSKLEALLARLNVDDRHWQMEIMYNRPITTRCYPKFGMLYGAEAAIADANLALKQALDKADQIAGKRRAAGRAEEASEKSERIRTEVTQQSEMAKTGLMAAQQHTSSLQSALRHLNDRRDQVQLKLQRTSIFRMSKRRELEREVASLRLQISEKDKQLEKATVYQEEALAQLTKQLAKQAETDAVAAKMLNDAEKTAKRVRGAAERANQVALKEAKHKAEQTAMALARSEDVGLPVLPEADETRTFCKSISPEGARCPATSKAPSVAAPVVMQGTQI